MVSSNLPRRSSLLLSTCLMLIFSIQLWGLQEEPASADRPQTPSHIRTVFLIVMENHNWTGRGGLNIKDNLDAPYINHTIVPMASHANAYTNPPYLHPSLPNYLWLEAGTDFGIHADGTAYTYHQSTNQHLTALLDKAGISWKSYEEGADGKQCSLTNWHDPFVFFDDVSEHMNNQSARCIAHIRPFSELKRDLEANQVARYNLIVPDLCDSMHNPCGGNAIAHGDEWLRQNVPAILNSTAYRSGGALFITWDESFSGDNPVPMLVLSPFAKGNGYSNSLHYTHGSTLRTLQAIFGVYPLLRDANEQRDLRDLFAVFP